MQSAECKVQSERCGDTKEGQEPGDLKARTKAFALRIIRMFCALPRTSQAEVLGKQVLRSGTSVGAHYREASRGRSLAEFVSKLEVGLQELDETAYWLELLVEAEIVPALKLAELRREADELTAMLVSSINTAKRRKEHG
jgi:four helix bundle protein